MSDVLTTPVVDVDVDLDAEVACECKEVLIIKGRMVGTPRPCERGAEWTGRYPCCGRIALLCDYHLNHRYMTFACEGCNHKFAPVSLVGLRRI